MGARSASVYSQLQQAPEPMLLHSPGQPVASIWGQFVSTMGDFRTYWPVILGYLAFQAGFD